MSTFISTGSSVRTHWDRTLGSRRVRERRGTGWRLMAASKKKKASSGGKERLSLKGFGNTARGAVRPPVELVREGNVDAFYKWLRKAGASFGRVGLGIVDGRRAVVALEPIEKDSIICSIPKKLALVVGDEDADFTEAAGNLMHIVSGHGGASSSFLQPYFDVMPAVENCDTPLLFTKDELSSLEYPEIQSAVQKQTVALENHYEQLKHLALYSGDMEDPVGTGLDFSIEELKWAAFIIRGALSIQSGEGGYVKTLIPLVDLMNHNPKSKHGLKIKKGQYMVMAGTEVKTGEEISIVYGGGGLSNFQLLLDYGIVEMSNENDVRQLLGMNRMKIRKGQELILADSLEKRLQSLKIPAEVDEEIIADSDKKGTREVVLAQFRREHRRALAIAIAELRKSGLAAK